MDTFRALHEGPGVLRLANVWDAGSARLVESLGAAAVATTSGGMAWSLGYADAGAMPAEVAIGAAANIARVLSVPLTIDLEDGYAADPRVVAGRVVRLAEVGIAGINIEDGGDEPAVLAAKVEAIRAALTSSGADVFVNVRTDVYLRGPALQGARASEVLARAKLYRDAGADGLFVPGIAQPAEIREVADAAGLPLNVMYLPGLPSVDELGPLGVRRLSAGTAIAQRMWGLARAAAEAFLVSGTLPAGPAMDYGEIQQLLSQGS